MRILIRSLALALAFGAIPLASAAAHECIVENRSDTGDERAAGSGRWIQITLADLYETTENFGLPDLTAAQVTYAVDLASSMGIPDAFTFRSDKLIGGSGAGWVRHGLATDGKGIDHFFEIHGEQLIAALFAALENA